MADRRDYYYRQTVTEAELDAGFEGLEQADRAVSVDHGLVGVVEGMGVSEKSGTPDLSVDVQGPGTAYSKAGERIGFSSTQNVDVSVDDGASSTAVGVVGNEKWISVFVEFDRVLSDPRIDGLSATVFFQRDESFVFSVVQGAEAVIGAATRPAIDAGKILLADVRRVFGDTQIFNAEIYTNRREDAYSYLGGTVEIIDGTAHDAIDSLLTALNQHLDGAANKHPAADIDYGGGGAWADGTTNPATTVEAQLDKIISDLATLAGGANRIGLSALDNWHDGTAQPATTVGARLAAMVTALVSETGSGGADKLGVGARTAWLGGRANAAGSIFDALDAIITDLADTASTDDGAERIGAATNGSLLSAGSVRSQLDELDAATLLRVLKAGDTMSGNLSFSGSADVVYSSARGRTLAIPLFTWPKDGSGWRPDETNFGEWETDGAIFDDIIMFDLLPFLPDGAIFQSCQVIWEQSGSFGTASDQMRADLYRHQSNFSTGARTVTDVVGFGTLFGAGSGVAVVNINPSDFTIDRQTTTLADSALVLQIEAAAGGTSRVRGVQITFLDPGPRNY